MTQAPTATRPSTALFTDRYELTMFEAALASGVAHRRAVFEVFARSLPPGRRYGVFCGLGRLLEAIEDFQFGPGELEYLSRAQVVGPETVEELARVRFSGDVVAYAEGDLYFPDSPVLTVEGPFGEALLLETLVLSILSHDSAIASAAARMAAAAGDRPLIEMGARRTDAEAGVHAARAAYVAGFASTSNLEAGRRYGIPTVGTVSHAFILAHPSEADAFAAQVAAAGTGTTLLVDTFDTQEGIRTAVRVAGTALGAVRIDSGDLGDEARRGRQLLDELGATETRIVATGDLDELVIAELAESPVDGYGVGTQLVTGSGQPTAGFIYKLVARADSADPDAPLRPVAKTSPEKATVGGRKTAWRLFDEDGYACEERLVTDPDAGPPPAPARALQLRVVEGGQVLELADLEAARAHHQAARDELRPEVLRLDPGPPALTAAVSTTDR